VKVIDEGPRLKRLSARQQRETAASVRSARRPGHPIDRGFG
jgi:hypothetical protein